MNIFFILVLLVTVLLLATRTFLMFSDKFRAKYYHKLTNDKIDEITSQPQTVWFTLGAIAGKGDKALLHLENDTIVLEIKGDKEYQIKVDEIKKIQISGVGWLLIWPGNSKALAIVDDGRWGIFFGNSQWQKIYGLNLPFFWQPYAKATKAADKKALAFLFKIKSHMS